MVLFLIHLSSVGASLGKTSLSSGRLAEHNVAVSAQDNGLGVTEYGGDLKASGAFNVHEKTVGRLNETLQLVGSCFLSGSGVEKIDWHCGCMYVILII